jgi:molybdenum cofactor synthesis domain-containing protein
MKKTAAVILIGDELLSGRTQDVNFQQIAIFLGAQGIEAALAKIIGDNEAEIIDSVQKLSEAYDYVFTTGGIGPTHDDITAGAVAKAMGVPLERNPEAVRAVKERFALNRPNEEVGEARLKMADIPQGAELITNLVSGAPGFNIKNVYVLAGVPLICEAMLDSLAEKGLEGGEKWLSRTLRGRGLAEGDIAEKLGSIQEAHEGMKIGSYPSFSKEDGFALRIVLRAPESLAQTLDSAQNQVADLMKSLNSTPEIE